MREYLALLEHVLAEGDDREDRTKVGTRSCLGLRAEYDLSKGFPLVTTKKVHLPSIVHELLWMISGQTNVNYLRERGVTIWDEWANDDGELGPIYGKQWRAWETNSGTIDQLKNVIERIKRDPYSRRHIVTAWNPADVDDMALPPCHMQFQFYVSKGTLSCQMYQRSADLFLGVPFNIASYAILTHMVAHLTGLQPGRFIHVLGDAHIYHNHFDQVRTQLAREPKPLPTLEFLRKVDDIDDFQYEDIKIIGYQSHKKIKAPIAA